MQPYSLTKKSSVLLVNYDLPADVVLKLNYYFSHLSDEDKQGLGLQAFQRACHLSHSEGKFEFGLPFIVNSNFNFQLGSDGTLNAESCAMAQGFNLLVLSLMQSIAVYKKYHNGFELVKNYGFSRFFYTAIV